MSAAVELKLSPKERRIFEAEEWLRRSLSNRGYCTNESGPRTLIECANWPVMCGAELEDGTHCEAIVRRGELPRVCPECGAKQAWRCLWINCKYHVYVDVLRDGDPSFPLDPDGSKGPTAFEHTCILDIVARGPQTLETVGGLLDVTRERARQLESKALPRMRRKLEFRGLTFDELIDDVGSSGDLHEWRPFLGCEPCLEAPKVQKLKIIPKPKESKMNATAKINDLKKSFYSGRPSEPMSSADELASPWEKAGHELRGEAHETPEPMTADPTPEPEAPRASEPDSPMAVTLKRVSDLDRREKAIDSHIETLTKERSSVVSEREKLLGNLMADPVISRLLARLSSVPRSAPPMVQTQELTKALAPTITLRPTAAPLSAFQDDPRLPMLYRVEAYLICAGGAAYISDITKAFGEVDPQKVRNGLSNGKKSNPPIFESDRGEWRIIGKSQRTRVLEILRENGGSAKLQTIARGMNVSVVGGLNYALSRLTGIDIKFDGSGNITLIEPTKAA